MSDHTNRPDDERLDRNLIELLNELRITGTGIQVLLAFLVIVPFDSGYRTMSVFDKIVYFVALLTIASAALLLIAPTVHHRILFRHGERPYIVRTANELALLGMALLGAGLIAILVLLSNIVFGTSAAIGVGVAAAARSLSSSVRQLRREFSERPPRCLRVC